MNVRRISFSLFAAILIGVLLSSGRRIDAGQIQVGLAQVDITPPIGGHTRGYRSAKPTDGVHDPLSAHVLILRSDKTTAAIVSWDLCVVNSPWLFEQVKPLGINHLLLANTHTHAGPKLSEEDFPSPEEPWRRTVEQRVLDGIREAQKAMFPASFAAGEGTIQIGYNRLVRKEGAFAVTHFENPDLVPFGPVDPMVGVVRITDDKNAVRAVVVNYACHPVVLGPKNRKISADYPGVMREIVEKQFGANAMCIFIQGCCGDINPMRMARTDDRAKDFDIVQHVGTQLSTEVLQVLDRLEQTPGRSDSLAVASSTTTFAPRWDSDERFELGVSTILINNEIAIMTMPGEPFHKYQFDFRNMAGLPHAYIYAYCCNGPYDWPSYLPDIVSAAHGGYGASDTTSVAIGAGERLVTRGLVQLFKLQGRLSDKPVRHIHKR